MKNRLLSIVLTLCMVLALVPAMTLTAGAAWDGSTITQFAKGTGTEADPFLISAPEHLAYLAKEINAGNTAVVGKHFRQTADLDLGDKLWKPIGKDNIYPFIGHFDGQGYKIEGLYVEAAIAGTDSGLFGRVDAATIENVHVKGKVTTGTRSGGLAGKVDSAAAVIRYCSAEVNVTGDDVGGFVGYMESGKIYGCYATGTVTGTSKNLPGAGGFVGVHYRGEITACSASGNVTATDETDERSAYAGGFVGYLYAGGSEKACYATGAATANSNGGNEYSGGYVGNRADSAKVADCYGVGATLVGKGDATGVTAKTEAEMKTVDFTKALNSAMPTDDTRTASWIQTAAGAAPIPVQPFFKSGTGAEADPFLIENEAQLRSLADYVNLGNGAATMGKYFRQTAELYLGEKPWKPIGKNYTNPFTGHYDGQGYKIEGLEVTNVADTASAGLFGYVGNATIENVHVSGTVSSGAHSGGLAGYVNHKDAVIRYCSANVTVENSATASVSNAGGFVGFMMSGKIYGCYATGNATAVGTHKLLRAVLSGNT